MICPVLSWIKRESTGFYILQRFGYIENRKPRGRNFFAGSGRCGDKFFLGMSVFASECFYRERNILRNKKVKQSPLVSGGFASL